MNYESDPLREVMRDLQRGLMRQITAEFCLGPKGEHFEGEEWERRADLLAGPDAGAYLRGELSE